MKLFIRTPIISIHSYIKLKHEVVYRKEITTHHWKKEKNGRNQGTRDNN
jgi:hypothetical protein